MSLLTSIVMLAGVSPTETICLARIARGQLDFGASCLVEVRLEIESTDGDAIQIAISNTGTWIEKAPTMQSTRVGLQNLRERLSRYYEDHARFETNAEQGWVHAVISIPWSIEEESEPRSSLEPA